MNESIIIRTDGFKVTTATLYGKEGEPKRTVKVKRHPGNKFNLENEVYRAIDRLFVEETIVGGETLKVKFSRNRKEVRTKSISIDNRLRGKGTLLHNSRCMISSICSPGMTKHSLYVLGSECHKDKNESTCNFVNEEEAKEYVTNMTALINEINKKYGLNAKE